MDYQLLIRLLCLSLVIAFMDAQGGTIARYGNPIKASSSGVDVAGAAFMLNDIVLVKGVLFAFRAYHRSDKAIKLQVWRPVPNSPAANTFSLIYEIRNIASLVDDTEDIYIQSKLDSQCTLVETQDRLGIYFEEAPGAVAYRFDKKSPRALGIKMNVTAPVKIGESIVFDSLVFPYDFSMAAYIDTDLSKYNLSALNPSENIVKCPDNLLIPEEPTITLPQTTVGPPPTGRPGATGPIGPRGPSGPAGSSGAPGDLGATGPMGATGPQGPTGKDGDAGTQGIPGSPGRVGPAGATGQQGPKGEMGKSGPRGPPGSLNDINGEPVSFVEESFLTGDGVSILLLIWLAIVTIALIILIVVLCCYWCRRRRARQNDPLRQKKNHKFSERMPSLYATVTEKQHSKNGGSTHLNEGMVDDEQSWLESMKSSSEISHNNDTLTTGSSSPIVTH